VLRTSLSLAGPEGQRFLRGRNMIEFGTAGPFGSLHRGTSMKSFARLLRTPLAAGTGEPSVAGREPAIGRERAAGRERRCRPGGVPGRRRGFRPYAPGPRAKPAGIRRRQCGRISVTVAFKDFLVYKPSSSPHQFRAAFVPAMRGWNSTADRVGHGRLAQQGRDGRRQSIG